MPPPSQKCTVAQHRPSQLALAASTLSHRWPTVDEAAGRADVQGGRSTTARAARRGLAAAAQAEQSLDRRHRRAAACRGNKRRLLRANTCAMCVSVCVGLPSAHVQQPLVAKGWAAGQSAWRINNNTSQSTLGCVLIPTPASLLETMCVADQAGWNTRASLGARPAPTQARHLRHVQAPAHLGGRGGTRPKEARLRLQHGHCERLLVGVKKVRCRG